MRTRLKQFRIGQHLKQSELAERTGVSCRTYGLIERGDRGGSAKFWDNLQKEFNLSDETTRQLQKKDERGRK